MTLSDARQYPVVLMITEQEFEVIKKMIEFFFDDESLGEHLDEDAFLSLARRVKEHELLEAYNKEK